MRILSMIGLMGCISPGIELANDTDKLNGDTGGFVDTGDIQDPIDTGIEDSADTEDTQDTNDTHDTSDTHDTQDTQDTQDTNNPGAIVFDENYGLTFMEEQYLVLDGSMALGMALINGSNGLPDPDNLWRSF